MKKIVIFSGTTEGRTLSNLLSLKRTEHTVCVASDYGKDMMTEDPYAHIHVGRMDKEGMKLFLVSLADKEGMVVIDATHPYATDVTDNIRQAAAEKGYEYIRIKRKESVLPKEAMQYGDIAECAAAVDKLEGNILLTTGSKELGRYCENVSAETKARTYVRVLPSAESIRICEEQGVEARHVIAMQGPFSTELNEALIRQYEIKHLISKDGGTNGGFEEKLTAAVKNGVQLHVLSRPVREEGVSVEEAYRILTGNEFPAESEELRISLIGTGMGDTGCMTIAAREAAEKSEVVFGAERLLGSIVHPHKYAMYKADDIIPVLEKERPKSAAVVFSGDTGFYSGAKFLAERLREWKEDADIRILPGISSFSYLAAALGESYEDAGFFSLHGKNSEKDYIALVKSVRQKAKVFVLLSGSRDIPELAGRLIQAGIKGSMCIGVNMSYNDETIRELDFEEAMSYQGEGIVTALIRNRQAEASAIPVFKKDEDFIRGDIPMTKECIRHESIIRLEMKDGDVFYDIGGGTGSVAIEAAAMYPASKVVTIEKKKEAVELIRENIKKAGTGNVEVMEGEAAEILRELGRPDCVFIGGSGGRLAEIIDILRSKGEGIRYVINAVSLETLEEVRKIIKQSDIRDERTIMISVSEARKMGAHHIMTAQNPVWIFSFSI